MTVQYPHCQGPVKWISTGWLQDHLDDEGLTILDTQPSVHDYIMEHIPGALYLNEGLFKVPLNGVPVHYGPVEAVEANLRRLGLTADLPVVVYTGEGPALRGLFYRVGRPPRKPHGGGYRTGWDCLQPDRLIEAALSYSPSRAAMISSIDGWLGAPLNCAIRR